MFLYGFAKNDREYIKDDELTVLKEIAAAWMAADAKKIERTIKEGKLHDVNPKEGKIKNGKK